MIRKTDRGEVFACNPDESAGLQELELESRGPEPCDEPLEQPQRGRGVRPHLTIVDRGAWPGTGHGRTLGPGERVVNGRVLYSAAWLDDPELRVRVGRRLWGTLPGAALAALALALPMSAVAGPVPSPPGTACVTVTIVDADAGRRHERTLCYRTTPVRPAGLMRAG